VHVHGGVGCCDLTGGEDLRKARRAELSREHEVQPDAPADATEKKSDDTRKSGKQTRGSAQQEQETLIPDSDDPTKRVTQSKLA
jgi:hypothetical protein